MRKIIGYLKNLTGEYYAKDAEGKLRELHPGDPVYAGETVVDGEGNPQPDALKPTAGQEEPPQTAGASAAGLEGAEPTTDEAKEPRKEPQSHTSAPGTTEYQDTLQENYAEVNIKAPLYDGEFPR